MSMIAKTSYLRRICMTSKHRGESGEPGRLSGAIRDGGAMAEHVDVEGRSDAARTAAIIPRAVSASTAPAPIEPSPPALETAAAIAGVETPAVGACTIGRGTPSI